MSEARPRHNSRQRRQRLTPAELQDVAAQPHGVYLRATKRPHHPPTAPLLHGRGYTPMPDWQQTARRSSPTRRGHLVALRRRLHANPEPSGAELEASLALYQTLDQPGLALRMGPDGCGVLADNARGGRPTPRRLPRRYRRPPDPRGERRPLPQSAATGVMHACGHDAHAAIATHVALAPPQARPAASPLAA